MLEHQKIVLNGVKNNKKLFRKELLKSIDWLNDSEQAELRKWVREKFFHHHADIIRDVFQPQYEQVG